MNPFRNGGPLAAGLIAAAGISAASSSSEYALCLIAFTALLVIPAAAKDYGEKVRERN